MRRYLTLLGDIDPVVLHRRKPVEGQVLTEDSGGIYASTMWVLNNDEDLPVPLLLPIEPPHSYFPLSRGAFARTAYVAPNLGGTGIGLA